MPSWTLRVSGGKTWWVSMSGIFERSRPWKVTIAGISQNGENKCTKNNFIDQVTFSRIPPSAAVASFLPLNQPNTPYPMPKILENASNRHFNGKITFSKVPPNVIVASILPLNQPNMSIRCRRFFKTLQITISIVKSPSPRFPQWGCGLYFTSKSTNRVPFDAEDPSKCFKTRCH